MNNILAVIVSYYPDDELFRKNVAAIRDNVGKILVWENTPDDDKERYRFCVGDKIAYVGGGKNYGIPHALNYAWRYAEKHGFDYLLTMDQDTVWHDFGYFVNATVGNPSAPVGIWAPTNQAHDTVSFQSADFVITSGTLVSIDILRKLGGWNQKYKVDGVDNDFCCRALARNINIYTVTAGWIKQRGGMPTEHHIGRHTFISYNYPSLRLYNIYKNHLITFRYYRNVPAVRGVEKSWKREWMKYRLFSVVLEKRRMRKLLAIVAGILMGLLPPVKR